MITRVNVNVRVIQSNRKYGKDDPPIRISRGRRITYAREVKVGEGRFVYSPDKPLKCGAKVWIETESPLLIW